VAREAEAGAPLLFARFVCLDERCEIFLLWTRKIAARSVRRGQPHGGNHWQALAAASTLSREVAARTLLNGAKMNVQRIAAFSDGEFGGNPAGVVICGVLPDASVMQAVAARVGYSETAFAAPVDKGWRVRYFSPESEVPFCGHATIALGAALALEHGDGVFALSLNHADITVEGAARGNDGCRRSAIAAHA